MEDDKLNEPYYFESDHVALKGNADYHKLLSAIALLEAQRSHAVRDLDTLLRQQDESLADPVEFVRKLQNKEGLDLPGPQKIAELPRIDWDRYKEEMGDGSVRPRHATRNQQNQGASQSEQSSAKSSRSNTPTPTEDAANVVRGKKKEGNKPATFNKLWTLEEQTRLEELLVKYPPEEIEARRWEKIAQELGNRTRAQVQSRVQKYFIRLAREGMPVPGRVPSNYHSTSGRRRHGNQRSVLQQSTSTFCAAYKPPVYMSDDEDSWSGIYTRDAATAESLAPPRPAQEVYVSDEEDIPEALRESDEYLEILHIKRMKKARLLQENKPQRHEGYKCDRCGMQPITGPRFHCQDCPAHTSVDLCRRCEHANFETSDHKSWHHVSEISLETASTGNEYRSHQDPHYDHSQFISGDYNYLDPNYMPAT